MTLLRFQENGVYEKKLKDLKQELQTFKASQGSGQDCDSDSSSVQSVLMQSRPISLLQNYSSPPGELLAKERGE